MKYKHYCFLVVILLVNNHIKAQNAAPTATEELSVKFNDILKSDISNSKYKISGISMSVIAPDINIKWSGAEGFDSTEKTNKLSENQPFRIASVTKTFVSAAILRLYEDGKLKLDDPISKYISAEHQTILKQGGYQPDHITIKHCLQHTSGLFDYAMGGNDYIKTARKNPNKKWTRTEQLQFAMDHGKPIGNPGEQYKYSDTGYIILGETIEKLTETGLAEGLRTLLNFSSLKLSSTWLEGLEPKPDGLLQPVHRYMENLDTTSWDSSVDLYGGGGLSSTTKDLTVFFHALFNHKVFKNKETLQIMLAPNKTAINNKNADDYRMGIQRMVSKKYNVEAFFHEGFWNTIAIHIPEYNCTVAINYTNQFSNHTLSETVGLIKQLRELQ